MRIERKWLREKETDAKSAPEQTVGRVLAKDTIVRAVDMHINQILRKNLYELNLDKKKTLRLAEQKKELRGYLKRAGTGDRAAKEYLIAFIAEILLQLYRLDETSIDRVYLFSGNMDAAEQFAVLLFLLEKEHSAWALERLIEDNHLLAEGKRNEITAEQIERVLAGRAGRLSFEEKLVLLSRQIYAAYKGLGVIDEIRDMHIDGVSGGVSGTPGDYRSVWIFYHGQSIHLSFLDFGSEQELERICRNICRYRQPGELSRERGFLVHEMADRARVVVARPDFAENWMFFVRKLDNLACKSLAELFPGMDASVVRNLLKWIVKGCQVTGITGMQGCGKTTLLMALVEEIPEEYTIRVLELAFELHLRERYPDRNIVTFRETASVDGSEGLEVQKKTDGAVSIIGEVVGARVAAWMIESGQSGSLFTLFTHHAKTTESLVYSLRNQLLKEANFRAESVALAQVVDVVRFDVHLHMDRDGHRYIERISEIIPDAECMGGFRVQVLAAYEDGVYVQKERLSDATRREIGKWLTREEREEFLHADL